MLFLAHPSCGLIHTLKLNGALRQYAIVIGSVSLGGLRWTLGIIKCKIFLQHRRVISLSHGMSSMGSLYRISKLKEKSLCDTLAFSGQMRRAMVDHTMVLQAFS